jgi:MoxR-like ATPase
MPYTPLFNPPTTFYADASAAAPALPGDQREGRVYVYDPHIVLAVNVALATGRPLLIYGASGSGKSSLARNIAHFQKWRFVERVITSRTQARDLLYQVDLLRRLHDAQAAAAGQRTFGGDYGPYVVPGPLWWAFNRASAKEYAGTEPKWDHEHARAVVLLDEIDKADPDLPNNLLVPLGSLEFEVEELHRSVAVEPKHTPLVILTTNEERELPTAFLRRCVELRLKVDRGRLLDIARAHFPDRHAWVDELGELVLSKDGNAALPSPAEFVDWLRACDTLGREEWQNIKDIVIRTAASPGDTK